MADDRSEFTPEELVAELRARERARPGCRESRSVRGKRSRARRAEGDRRRASLPAARRDTEFGARETSGRSPAGDIRRGRPERYV